MPLLDTIQNAALKVLPEKKPSLPLQTSHTGIGSGGMVPFEDDVSIFIGFLLQDLLVFGLLLLALPLAICLSIQPRERSPMQRIAVRPRRARTSMSCGRARVT